jgi:hypothetical protein
MNKSHGPQGHQTPNPVEAGGIEVIPLPVEPKSDPVELTSAPQKPTISAPVESRIGNGDSLQFSPVEPSSPVPFDYQILLHQLAVEWTVSDHVL